MDCQKHGEVVGELMLVCPVCPASVLAAGQELEAKHAAALEVVKAAKADHAYHYEYKKMWGRDECLLCDAISAFESLWPIEGEGEKKAT